MLPSRTNPRSKENSSPEQRHLLTKIANVFPAFINMLTVTASPKERDVIFRFYPFVLSKGIFIAFKFLCPGNRSLFKGAFQRILYLSIFRLLTGLDICPESIDALRLKLYPEDINEEDSDAADQDNELRPMGNERENQRSANVHLKSNLASELKNSKRSLTGAKAHDTIRHSKRDSLVKFVGERDSLRYRPLKKLSPKKLPRQQQVKFDAYQISPLLQQHLGRESNSVGPKHFIKRTEPVAHCKSGGVETYQCLSDSRIIESEDQLLQEHKRKTNELKMASMKSNFSNRKQLKELQSQCAKILSGGREKVQEFASTISSGGTR